MEKLLEKIDGVRRRYILRLYSRIDQSNKKSFSF